MSDVITLPKLRPQDFMTQLWAGLNRLDGTSVPMPRQQIAWRQAEVSFPGAAAAVFGVGAFALYDRPSGGEPLVGPLPFRREWTIWPGDILLLTIRWP